MPAGLLRRRSGGRGDAVDHLDGGRSLRYRFGDRPSARTLDPTGLVGLVTAALPPAGSTAVLDLVGDTAALWPRDLATDNGLVMLGVS